MRKAQSVAKECGAVRHGQLMLKRANFTKFFDLTLAAITIVILLSVLKDLYTHLA